jgi:hypothetical protein
LSRSAESKVLFVAADLGRGSTVPFSVAQKRNVAVGFVTVKERPEFSRVGAAYARQSKELEKTAVLASLQDQTDACRTP